MEYPNFILLFRRIFLVYHFNTPFFLPLASSRVKLFFGGVGTASGGFKIFQKIPRSVETCCLTAKLHKKNLLQRVSLVKVEKLLSNDTFPVFLDHFILKLPPYCQDNPNVRCVVKIVVQ